MLSGFFPLNAQSILLHAENKYEVKIEESEKTGSRRESNQDTSGLSYQCSATEPQQDIYRIVRVGGCLAVVAQWQSNGGSSQRCPGFHSWQLLAFSLSSIFIA